MKLHSVLNHGLQMTFHGDLLSHKSSKKPGFKSWTEFFIYYTDKESFVVDIVRMWDDGRKRGRSFVCKHLYEVQQVLCHPVYKTISYTAQKAYNEARWVCIENNLIEEDEYPLEEFPLGEAIVAPSQQYYNQEDFDFSED